MSTGAPASAGTAADPSAPVDFFVSYTGADQGWAQWIAWQLEAAGYTTLIQAWDFVAGAHFVTEMHRAAQVAARTVAVLSGAYLSSAYAEAEWQAAWGQDPAGRDRRLVVFRVEDCVRPGLLGQLVSVDLFGVDPDMATTRLVAAASGERGKPVTAPVFPGGPVRPVVSASGVEPGFPGRLPAVWGPVPAPEPDRVEDTGKGTARGGGRVNTGLQASGDDRPGQVVRSGDARADGPGSVANTGIQRGLRP